jgi:DNA polymerase epsilon subunit 1
MFIPVGTDKKKTTELDIQQHSTQMLKKRYVIFNHKNEVSEFKGLEIKRRGELNIIKMFQSEIFHQYVKGNTLK